MVVYGGASRLREASFSLWHELQVESSREGSLDSVVRDVKLETMFVTILKFKHVI